MDFPFLGVQLLGTRQMQRNHSCFQPCTLILILLWEEVPDNSKEGEKQGKFRRLDFQKSYQSAITRELPGFGRKSGKVEQLG